MDRVVGRSPESSCHKSQGKGGRKGGSVVDSANDTPRKNGRKVLRGYGA